MFAFLEEDMGPLRRMLGALFGASPPKPEDIVFEPIDAPSETTRVQTAEVPASGARLFAIRVPPNHGLALGVSGTPLLQMSLFAADGSPLAPRGPLRVVTVGSQKSSPVQLLVTNDGVAPTRISLSLRADPPPPSAVPEPPVPGELPSPPERGEGQANPPASRPESGPPEVTPAEPAAPQAPTPPASAPEPATEGAEGARPR